MKKTYRLLFALHVFVGVGALIEGFSTFVNPKDPLGMPVESLANSPFSNFLIPGVILFSIIGLGNIISAFTLRYNLRYQGYLSSVFSGALVIWIVVQCIMLKTVAFIHVIFFGIGLIKVILSIIIMVEHNLFPTNLLRNLYKEKKNI